MAEGTPLNCGTNSLLKMTISQMNITSVSIINFRKIHMLLFVSM